MRYLLALLVVVLMVSPVFAGDDDTPSADNVINPEDITDPKELAGYNKQLDDLTEIINKDGCGKEHEPGVFECNNFAQYAAQKILQAAPDKCYKVKTVHMDKFEGGDETHHWVFVRLPDPVTIDGKKRYLWVPVDGNPDPGVQTKIGAITYEDGEDGKAFDEDYLEWDKIGDNLKDPKFNYRNQAGTLVGSWSEAPSHVYVRAGSFKVTVKLAKDDDHAIPLPDAVEYVITFVKGTNRTEVKKGPIKPIKAGTETIEVKVGVEHLGGHFECVITFKKKCYKDMEDTHNVKVLMRLESYNPEGDDDSFWQGQPLFFDGSDLEPEITIPLYVVEDMIWEEGTPIPPGMPYSATAITTDNTGRIAFSDFEEFGDPPALIWPGDVTLPGMYDIVLDLDNDGYFTPGVDSLDDNDVGTAGFEVVSGSFVCLDEVTTYSGSDVTLTINLYGGELIAGGFDLLLTYDRTVLSFLDAVPGGVLGTLGWEYFTYRHGVPGNCGDGCPSGMIRLIGIADMPGGVDHPEFEAISGELVLLHFRVTDDLNFIGQCAPVSFYWEGCEDNIIANILGDTAFVDISILDADAEVIWDETDDVQYPEAARLPSVGTPDSCLDNSVKGALVRRIVYCNGRVCIIPPPDDRGDINLNGISNEIADAVLFSNYFIFGPGVWDPVYYENQILATDVNDDGIPLTIADMVYLIRIITGDAIPYGESGEGGKIAPYADAVDISYTIGEDLVVSAISPVSVGGAAFIFHHTGELGTPVLNDAVPGMTLRSSDVNGELRVLVFSMEHHTIPAGNHDLFTLPTNGNSMELVEVQLSDGDGNLLAVSSSKIAPPATFELMQNYPNPFNAGTMIRFALPVAADWNLRVYNVAGRMVKEFKGHHEAGMVNLYWDATAAASGIYFYRLNAGDFTENKKMVLMK